MNILRVRDENGQWMDIPALKGADGKDYVLTDADKREIANMVSAGITEEQVLALIRAELESAGIAYVGSEAPASDLGKDGDIYIVTG